MPASPALLSLWAGLSQAQEPPGIGPPPEDPYVAVVNPTMDLEPGVRTALSLGRVVFLYDDALSGLGQIDESTVPGRIAGIAGRLGKFALVDGPLAGTEALLVHEVIGHGGRGREVGLEPYYQLGLVPPYGALLSHPPEGTPLGSATVGRTGDPDRDVLIHTGGIESEYTAAWWLQVSMLERDGWMHYSELLRYGVYKNSYRGSLADAPRARAPEGGNDVANYVTYLQLTHDRWRPSDRRALERRLRTAYWFNYVDPTFWLAAFHGLWSYGVLGERDVRMPLLAVGDWQLYPGTRFGLSPFGAEHTVDLFARTDGVVFDLYGRGVSTGLAPSWGGGLRVFGVRARPWLQLGAELDVWRQPEVLLADRYVFDRGQRVGANVGLHYDVRLRGPVGLVGKVAGKTRGYVASLPLDKTVHGYVGLSYTP